MSLDPLASFFGSLLGAIGGKLLIDNITDRIDKKWVDPAIEAISNPDYWDLVDLKTEELGNKFAGIHAATLEFFDGRLGGERLENLTVARYSKEKHDAKFIQN